MKILDRPILKDTFARVSEFSPHPDAALISGEPQEDRQKWSDEVPFGVKRRIQEIDIDSFACEIEGETKTFNTRSIQDIELFISLIGRSVVYLDITSLSHHVWAPILRGIHKAISKKFYITYVEPKEYSKIYGDNGQIFDLSEKIQGLSPIPGFISLADELEDKVCLIALLGFEGRRFAHVLEKVDPPGGKIVPIIGLPGFRAEYPFHTIHSNRVQLNDTQSWKKIRFADADNPFQLYYVLEDIAAEYPTDLLKIALLGTKPHALGSLLFAMRDRRQIEFIYDHPIRKSGRTDGSSRIHIYRISDFLRS